MPRNSEVSAFIPRSPDSCWRVLVDVSQAPAWVPGLRRAVVIATGPHRLPAEVHFEFSASLTYTLVYTYDVAAREMTFEPRLGKRDGVSGFARIEPFDAGSKLTYSLQEGENRSAADRAIGDPQVLVDSFARWMQQQR